jgi:hypothetical protein
VTDVTRRILAGGGRVFMADIDTQLGEETRNKLRAEFGQVPSTE